MLITCEHAGNRIPARYKSLFAGRDRMLASHRGWDPGALDLARRLSRSFRAPLIASTISRLVVDLNRSIDNPTLFSPLTRPLPAPERQRILADHYHPYRRQVQESIRTQIARTGAAIHLSIHTFTPILRGVRRDVDVGLLFDPARKIESTLCAAWLASFPTCAAVPRRGRLKVHFNRPYHGREDGLTTHLRTLFPDPTYAGIELEVNQRLLRAGPERWNSLCRQIECALKIAIDSLP